MLNADMASILKISAETRDLGAKRYSERRSRMDWCQAPGSERNLREKYTFDGLLEKARKEQYRRGQRRSDGVVVRRESLQRQLSREGRLGKDGEIRRGRPVSTGKVRRVKQTSTRKGSRVVSTKFLASASDDDDDDEYLKEDQNNQEEEDDYYGGVEETKEGGAQETTEIVPRRWKNDDQNRHRTSSAPASNRYDVDRMTDAELVQLGKDLLKQGARAERKPYSIRRRSGSLPPESRFSRKEFVHDEIDDDGNFELQNLNIPEKRPLIARAKRQVPTKSQEEEDDEILAQPLPWQQEYRKVSNPAGVYGGSTSYHQQHTSRYTSLDAARAAARAKRESDSSSSYITSAIESARATWYA